MPSKEIQPYLAQIARLKSEVRDQANKVVTELQSEIIPFITERQLIAKGIDGKGRFLGSYAPFTIALKKAKGEIYTHTTLLDTGDFYEGFYVIGKYGQMHIFSTDSKTEELVERYGPDIFTLSVDHNQIVNTTLILPKLVQWILNSLQI